MIVLISLIVLTKGIVSTIPTPPFIQLNDVCTCSTNLCKLRV